MASSIPIAVSTEMISAFGGKGDDGRGLDVASLHVIVKPPLSCESAFVDFNRLQNWVDSKIRYEFSSGFPEAVASTSIFFRVIADFFMAVFPVLGSNICGKLFY